MPLAGLTSAQLIANGEDEWINDTLGQDEQAYVNALIALTGIGSNNTTNEQPVYFLSYQIKGVLDAFRVTNDFKYLERIITWLYELISNATNFSGADYNDAFYDFLGDDNNNKPLWDSHGLRDVFTMLVMMKNNPYILQTPIPANSHGRTGTYQNDYDYLLDWMYTNLWVKWTTRSAPTGVWARSQTHMNSHWVAIVRHLRILKPEISFPAVEDAYLYDMENYRTGWKGMISPVGGLLQTNPSYPQALTYLSDPPSNRVQDVSHANADVRTFTMLYEIGDLTYAEARMARWIACFDFIYPNFGLTLDAVLMDGSTTGWPNDLNLLNGWCELGRFDLSLQLNLETHDKTRYESAHRISTSWFQLALNKAILEGDPVVSIYERTVAPVMDNLLSNRISSITALITQS